MRFTGNVRNDGSVRLDDKSGFVAACSKLRGKRISLSLIAEQLSRSNPQNRRFFGVIVPVCRHALNLALDKRGALSAQGLPLVLTKEEVHEFLDRTYLGETETAVGRFRRHCSQLGTAEFSKFCDEIEADFSSKFGAVFPSEEWMVEEAGL